MSQFAIRDCMAEDMAPGFVLVSETFKHDQPYHDACWPDHWLPHGQKVGGERFELSLRTEPKLRFIRAVNKADNKLAGLVRYYVLDDGTIEEKELEGDYWPNQDAKEYAQHLYREYLSSRRTTVNQVPGPFVCLDMLCIHPDFQSKGAGRALVKWGTDLADEMGAQICYYASMMTVESSMQGLEVYQKHGFRIVKEITLSVPQKWENRPKTHFWFMRRGIKGEDVTRTN